MCQEEKLRRQTLKIQLIVDWTMDICLMVTGKYPWLETLFLVGNINYLLTNFTNKDAGKVQRSLTNMCYVFRNENESTDCNSFLWGSVIFTQFAFLTRMRCDFECCCKAHEKYRFCYEQEKRGRQSNQTKVVLSTGFSRAACASYFNSPVVLLVIC